MLSLVSNNKTHFLTNTKVCKKKINLNFYFVSLIPPFIVNNVRLGFNNSLVGKKILIKQSYILLTWFYYLNFLEKNTSNKNKLKFSVMPNFYRKFTLTKAPMAHKNWSKEQYKFQYYRFKINFRSMFQDEEGLTSLNKAILFLLISKKTFPQFETNLILLKNTSFLFCVNDINFFNYYLFSQK